jgi:hypothetical protein
MTWDYFAQPPGAVSTTIRTLLGVFDRDWGSRVAWRLTG